MIKNKSFQKNQVLGKKHPKLKVNSDKVISIQNSIIEHKLKSLTRRFKVINCRLSQVKFVIPLEKKKMMTLI